MRLPHVYATLLLLAVSSAATGEPVKVFILAGQSNMEGKAKMSLLDYQATAPETKATFAHFRDGDDWAERDDVWIKFLDRRGPLTVGYGSPKCIGPELQFGWTMGDHYRNNPVLIIKTAWGGKSLYRDFRPPSAGLPNDDVLGALLERQQKRRPETTAADIRKSFGHYYREMIKDVRTTLESIDTLFPDLDHDGHELAGFVWFQGWNDMVNADYTAEYTANMTHFIRDVRKDLDAAELPFVIGQLGVGGTKEKRPNKKKDEFKQAQAAAGELPEFKNNVAVVKTDQYWDMEADAVFSKGWKENLEQWNKVGSDRPYHYLGSAKCYSRMGAAFAEALLELQTGNAARTAFYDPIVKDIEGWTIKVDPQLIAQENAVTAERAFEALANHLQRVKYIVPAERVEQLMKLPIWLELNNERLSSMQYHPSRGWLLSNDHDPRLVKHVHIPRAKALFDPGMWAKHPYVVLHELAHSFHDQILSFDNQQVIDVFSAAEKAGIYEEVLLYTGKTVRHYGLSNHKEYFAESTEAYFGVNDFYPFVRAELKEHDPKMFDLMRDVWGPIR